MIEEGAVKGINSIYEILKLSGYFWLLSLIGGGILGVAPAFVSLLSKESGSVKIVGKKALLKLFLRVFIKSNFIFIGAVCLLLLLSFSLRLSIELDGLVFIMIDFLIPCIIILITLVMCITLMVVSQYTIAIMDAVKISLYIFFSLKRLVLGMSLFVVGSVAIVRIYPAVLLFIIPGLVLKLSDKIGIKINAEVAKMV